MPLKTILEASEIEDLPEAVREHYTETEGKFVLDLDGIDDHPKVSALRNAHNRSKQERDEAKNKARSLQSRFGPLVDVEDLDFSDVDPDRVTELMPVLRGEKDLPQPGKAQDVDLDKIKALARKPLERELETAIATAESATQKLNSLVVDHALTTASQEIKVATPYVKAVRALFRDRVKVIEGDDGSPVAVVEGEYGEQPVDKYMKEWSQTDEGKAFIVADGNDGGGRHGARSGSAKGKNPWSKDHWSPKEHARIYREQAPRSRAAWPSGRQEVLA
jgi:hypothetical protein